METCQRQSTGYSARSSIIRNLPVARRFVLLLSVSSNAHSGPTASVRMPFSLASWLAVVGRNQYESLSRSAPAELQLIIPKFEEFENFERRAVETAFDGRRITADCLLNCSNASN